MNYKVQGALKKNKKTLIVAIVLWIIIAIVLISPLACCFFVATYHGGFNFDKFIETLFKTFMHPFQSFGALAQYNALGMYFKTLIGFTFFYSIIVIIGLLRSAPKNEYDNIEHGSSDWSQNGEQYQILNKNKGIILAENNYLPVDKRGNVNVLVVGRIRFR